MPADLNPILNKLISKSEEGKVSWKPTYDTDTFITALEGEFTFQITKVGPQYTFVMKDKEDRKLVEIASEGSEWNQRLLSSDITEKGEFMKPNDPYFEQLEHLFDLARDSALDVSQKLTAAESLLDRF